LPKAKSIRLALRSKVLLMTSGPVAGKTAITSDSRRLRLDKILRARCESSGAVGSSLASPHPSPVMPRTVRFYYRQFRKFALQQDREMDLPKQFATACPFA
jgi:hypothetical protein